MITQQRYTRAAICWGLLITVSIVVPGAVLGCSGQTKPTDVRVAKDVELNLEQQLSQLKSGDPRKRSLAAAILGAFGSRAQEAVPSLEKLKADPDENVRKVVEVALTKIQSNNE
jgi:HEAT repeat protein